MLLLSVQEGVWFASFIERSGPDEDTSLERMLPQRDWPKLKKKKN